MAEQQAAPAGPDLSQGVAQAISRARPCSGHVGDQEVLLVRSGAEIFAIDAHCSHYHGPLADGIVAGDGMRCPWHHACFDLRTGEATRAPALSPLGVWQVEQRGRPDLCAAQARAAEAGRQGTSRRARKNRDRRRRRGGFCRGRNAAAAGIPRQHRDAEQRCRRRRSIGRTCRRIISPAARRKIGCRCAPTISMPEARSICGSTATSPRSTPRRARSRVAGGSTVPYDRLLLATGAEPVRLTIPGADQPHVHTLRTLADCRAIIAGASGARRAVVIGASFIGLEVAAALARARDRSPCRGAGNSGRWSACSVPRWATSFAHCMKSMASFSISAIP